MGPLWLRLLPWCLSSKAVFGDLAGSLFMAIVGVVAIVDATVCQSANRTLRRDLPWSKPLVMLGEFDVGSTLSAMNWK